jgi:hypothetical protein
MRPTVRARRFKRWPQIATFHIGVHFAKRRDATLARIAASQPSMEAACEGSQHRPGIHAALNLLLVVSMRSGLAKPAFKAQHCHTYCRGRGVRDKFF